MQQGTADDRDGSLRSGRHLNGEIPFTFLGAEAVFDPFALE